MAKIGRRISSPSIDIAISFNDIEFNSYSVGYMKKYFRDKPISCSEQIVALSRSIQKNWPEMKNNIYALHSKKISNKNFKLLKKEGINVIYAPIEKQYDFDLHNRITVYSDFSSTPSDFTLVLDSDMLFLKPPSFDFSRLVQAGYESTLSNFDSFDVWKQLYEYFGLEWKKIDNFSYKKYQLTGEENFMPCINNGAILVKNTYKSEFKNSILEAEKQIVKIGLSDSTTKHYFSEIATSIAFQLAPKKSLFKPGINFIGKIGDNPYRLDYNNNIILYHYAGSKIKK